MNFSAAFDAINSPDLTGITAGERADVLRLVQAACTSWSWYLTPGSITVSVSIRVDAAYAEPGVLARGGPGDFFSDGRTDGPATVWESVAAIKLITGSDLNGSDTDIIVYLSPDAIKNHLYFRADPFSSFNPIPTGKYDAMTVFLHELGHGLGLLAFSDSISDPNFNQERTQFETFIDVDGSGNPVFTGPNAMAAANSSAGLALENNSISHFNDTGAYGTDLMSTALTSQTIGGVSAIDLGILQDIGIVLRQPTAGADVIHAAWGSALIDLGPGNDEGYAAADGSTIEGGVGNDFLVGDVGDDIFYGDLGADQLAGREGNDELHGQEGDDTLSGNDGVDFLNGGTGNDVLNGGNGDDELWGNTGNDTLDGGNGNDSLWCHEGDDWVKGNQGNDTLSGGAGNDILDGGDGEDVVVFATETPGISITIDLSAGTAFSAETGSDTILAIEDATLESIGDIHTTLIGNGGDNLLTLGASGSHIVFGGGGNDLIWTDYDNVVATDGGLGDDGLFLDRRLEVVGNQVQFRTAPTTLVFSPGAAGSMSDGTSFVNVEYLYLRTGLGDGHVTFDHPKMAISSSFEGVDYFENRWEAAGGGNDTVTVDLSGTAASLTLSGGSIADYATNSAFVTLVGIDNYHVTAGDANDYLGGADGSDILIGEGGNDRLTGGLGNDILDGGSGVDLAHFQGVLSDFVINTVGATTTVTGPDGTDTLTGIERLSFYFSTISLTPRTSLNGDSKSDILWQHNSGQAGVWLMDGTTILANPYIGTSTGPAWHVIGAGDFDGNGKADMLWQATSGQAGIWFMDGATVLDNPSVGSNPGPAWHVIASADLDGNGKSDIIWQHNNGQAGIWLMDGQTMLSNPKIGITPNPAWHVVAAGDLDVNGKADLIWRSDHGQIGIWFMDGETVLDSPVLSDTLDTSWKMVATGDFDADGFADLLWQNTNGQVAIWLMWTTQAVSKATIANPGTDWVCKGTADLNGDYKADILWQNVNGQAAAWMMSGTSILSQTNLGANPGTSWHVVAASSG